MDGLRAGGFVDGDTLEFFDESPKWKRLEGEIACKGGIVVDVSKTLEVLRGTGMDAVVQTVIYSYNVFLRGRFNIFRYDNEHPHKGHADPHHKHVFDWQTGAPLPESPKWIGAHGWPSLAEVIFGAQRWHSEHLDELPDPEAFPTLGVRG